MTEIKLTDGILRKYPYIHYFGWPHSKSLHEWFYKLDLDYCNILVKDPIDCLNFVTDIMHYYDDKKTHKMGEHWLQSAQEVYDWIFYKKQGDCDDAAVTLASILYSLNDPNIQLAIGYYGNPKYATVGKIQPNHAYCLYDIKGKLYLLDPVGDTQVNNIYLIEKHTDYTTMVSAEANGRVWLHGPYAKMCS